MLAVKSRAALRPFPNHLHPTLFANDTRERERERERERGRQRDREREGVRETEMDRETERQRGRDRQARHFTGYKKNLKKKKIGIRT